MYLFGQLVSIKTSDPRSAAYVRNLKGSGTFNSFSEAFMEAGPQLVLQLSIVYLRGYVGTRSWYQQYCQIPYGFSVVS